ncbi:MAG: SGNH/GDSL hydrolase family protein [Actinomycetota bacterium]|nr:SGNH/GDSL hydrolase family protein [Actinomycetota bacterium]
MHRLPRRTFLLATGMAITGGCGEPVSHSRAGQPSGTVAPQNKTDERVIYVALGDSMSIDYYAGGEGRGGASLLARNRDDDFPDWRGRDLATLDPTLGYHLLATNGATTNTLLDSQLPQLEMSAIAPTVVTITVGGNDLLGTYSDTQRARDVVSVVRTRVGQALGRLRSLLRRPSDPVIVGTVYDPSDGTGDASRVGLPPWPQVVDVLAELNAGLRGVAAEHGARVADIHGYFLGHGLRAGNPAQGNPRPANRDLWFCNVIEPNAWGASAVRAAFWDALHAG